MDLGNKAVKRHIDGVTQIDSVGKEHSTPLTGGTQIQRTVTIARSPQEVYAFWRDFSNLSFFMPNITSVTTQGNQLTHWVVKGPLDKKYEWDAAIIQDLPGQILSWRSTPEAEIENAGSVTFRPARGERGTEIRVTLAYDAPGGALGEWIGTVFGKEPAVQLAEDLRRLKQLLEAGEIPTAARRLSEVSKDRLVRTLPENLSKVEVSR